jgi:signal transduction histidine kinase
MSLRTKMMLSIFVFMVLVFGLLTLNLWLHAAAKAQAESRRNADLVASLVSYWVLEAAPRSGFWTDEDWAILSRKLSRWDLISGWTVAGLRDGKLRVIGSSSADPDRVLREDEGRFREAFGELKVDRDGERVYVPIPTGDAERVAARLDLRGAASPVTDLAGAMKGILTVMALGTALLLLNAYVFTNRLVLRPLGTLVEASNRVAEGDFSKKIPESDTYDEMGRMVRAFNLMIEKIADYHRRAQEDIKTARRTITQTERKLFAAQRLSTTGTLAAGIAHEINNPLGGMINAARVLKEGRLDEAKRAEYLELIADGLGRVRAIVQKILQFRPHPFEPQPMDLRRAVEQAVAFLEHRARAKEVTIRNELPADLPAVNGDPLELQQAFLNILMNAVDACVMGEGMVTVYHRRAGDALSVSVADNGCGMDEEELARCMDPFFTTKDVGEGTGLGLAVAHNIVTNHGGKIELRSERGRGTTVTLTLPVLKEGAPVRTGSQESAGT